MITAETQCNNGKINKTEPCVEGDFRSPNRRFFKDAQFVPDVFCRFSYCPNSHRKALDKR